VAQVAEVSMQDGQPRVHRVVCASTAESRSTRALSSSRSKGRELRAQRRTSRADHDPRGRVEQQNFPQYPLLRMDQAPIVETYLVPSERAPAGVGEPGTPRSHRRWPTRCSR